MKVGLWDEHAVYLLPLIAIILSENISTISVNIFVA
jgi:hypothetical protein